MIRTITLVLAAVAVTASIADAQGVTFDRLALQLNQGDSVIVTHSDGRRLRGRIVDLSASTLALQIDGLRRDLDGSDISVIRHRERDSLENGAAIGFGSGVAISVSLFALFGGLDQAGIVFFYSSLFGAAGAGIGAGLDAMHQEPRVVYRAAPSNRRIAVSPVVSPERQGVSVSLGF